MAKKQKRPVMRLNWADCAQVGLALASEVALATAAALDALATGMAMTSRSIDDAKISKRERRDFIRDVDFDLSHLEVRGE